ncbi:macrophage migration inhibitory factor-like [Saccostrea cucullata]|uniref:macrophage migration inhibitory factor-like n=1 Tax=Saccostrea cuccullata TaxID=36930 RepID=UPI002ED44FF1
MTMTSISAVIKTNVPRQSIRKDFLSKLTEYLCETYNTEAKRVIIEIHPDTPMMTGGLSAPMMNIEFYHNSDVISQTTKQKHASGMAKFMAEELRIPIDRVLVLFFDTRKCT